ncbi:MAG: transcription elongation factor GreA [Sulfuricurvum sp. PC08-66]|nr:MAG: transcription elongation factor GreA [Sulfuricurvum sp. PC08-66]
MQPQPMTLQAYDAISDEFNTLRTVIKPAVNREKEIAAAHGDRSENAEYHAAKEKLRHIDKRLKYLSSMLQNAKIIDPAQHTHERVAFGSTVELEDIDTDESLTLSIFGVLESEPQSGVISYEAPMARALMGKAVGDSVTVTLPSGKKEYEILAIRYIPILECKKEPFARAAFA